MSTLTIRLPGNTAQRLKSLAQSRGLSMSKLVDQLSVCALAAWDAESHFRAMAATGDVGKALAVLDRLDRLAARDGAMPVRSIEPQPSWNMRNQLLNQ